jgi:hypothetical protein
MSLPGYFTLSRSEETPATHPNLELHLAHAKDIAIKPGDIVSGFVHLLTPVPINPKFVEVAFWGQSQTWIRREHHNTNHAGTRDTDYYHYRDRASLFTAIGNLNPHPPGQDALVPGQTYKMPFTFTMPARTLHNRANCYQEPADGVWTVVPHDLPPTLFYGTWGPESPDQCSISYGVTARLICPGFDNDDVRCTLPVAFTPLNPLAHIQNPRRVRQSKMFILSSSTLTGQSESSIGFRQSLKDKFSSHAPKLNFELAVELPDLLKSGGEFAFRATFKALSKTENVTHIPEMTFRVLKLGLLDFTLFRGPRDWQANNYMSGDPSSWYDGTPRSSYRSGDEREIGEDKVLLNSLPESCTVALPQLPMLEEKEKDDEKGTEQGSECEAWFKARVPGTTAPSFQSFAITRTYHIKVKIGIEIGGKDFDFEVETAEVTLGSG